ncbi:two-component system response regulator [Pedobacter yulinensis]|uniref:Two-component system response regulator n=1 Tax=Pedobacter yulinensis TaxID=2126353 RepID=A0A2T3HJV8_9SPHI|nr:response regulator [Pedobacter yulinensis]PST82683.1 two-component system response regulator [Pedobacter yulinensis]
MNYQILIVDDNEDILELLCGVFKGNYTLKLAGNGEQALDILKNEYIDLIISDIMMPGMDGFELCHMVKSSIEYCHIPVVLLTVKNTHQSQIQGLELGADLYIHKPFSARLLQVQVANLLENRSKIKAHFASSPFEDVRVMAHSKTDETFLKKLDDYIRSNIKDTQMNIDQLAHHMHMSRPTLYRKIKSLSTLSPKELIDVTRLKTSTKLIARNEFTMFEIAKMVGYSSQSLFNKNFLRYFNMTPNEYAGSLQKEVKNE